MELRELRLERLPGLPERLTIAGGPGLNLVLGPNGSGKSTLTRAALGLLGLGPAPGPATSSVSGAWRHDGAIWHVVRAGGSAPVWQRDGQPHAPPPLPAVDQAASFRLGLLDLLKPAADRDDSGLAHEIRRQMAGGFDLAAMLKTANISGREGQTAAGELRAAEERVDELRTRQTAMQHDESRLAALREERTRAQQAVDRATALRAAQAAVEAGASAAEAAARLTAGHQAAMERVQEGDAQSLELLRKREQTATGEAAGAERDLAAAEQALAAAGLPDGGPPATALATARNRLADAQLAARDLQRAVTVLIEQEAAVQTAREHLAPWGEPSPDQTVDRDRLGAEARAVQAQLLARAEVDGFERVLVSPPLQPADGPAASAELLAAARRALLDWLSAVGERGVPWLALVAGAALLAVGIAARPWSAAIAWTGWLALGAAAVVLVAGYLPRLRRERSRRAREDLEATGLEPPPAWTEGEVRRHLQALGAQEAAAVLAALQRRLSEDLAAERDRAARTAGDSAPDERLDAAERLFRNADYHEALAARAMAIAGRDRSAEELRLHLAAVGRDLGAWLADPPDDLAGFMAAVDDLERRRGDHHAALDARRQAERRRAEQAALTRQTADEIRALLSRLDLPHRPESDAQVHALVDGLEDWRQEKAEVASLTAGAEARRRALDELVAPGDDLAREALAWPAERRAAELTAADAAANRWREVHDEIVAIETRLGEARRDTGFDRALLDRDRARDELAAGRDAVRATAIGRLLLERLQRRHRERSEPPVLHRARELFARFAAGRYELLVAEDDQESFRARDAATGEGLSLAQLSDGTRAQLLLAARLAYLQEAERGATMPLFLDEALTSTDPDRFAAVAGAVLDLIRDDDRQVFYLTCDPADVHAWQQLQAARGHAQAPVIDLASTRRQATAAPVERLRLVPRAPVPEPQPGEDPADYAARLGGVPALDPHAPPSAAHLLHLLRDDLPLLHRLLVARVERLGQVVPMAPSLLTAGAVAPAQLDTLRARARALAAFTKAWSIGRGRPVPAGAIAHSGLQSSKLPEIEDLLASPAIAGDAARLMAALERGEVPRLQQKVQTEIAEYLAREGHLDERRPHDRAEISALVFEAMQANLAAGALTPAVVHGLLDGWWPPVQR